MEKIWVRDNNSGSATLITITKVSTYLGNKVVRMKPTPGWFVYEGGRLLLLLLLLMRHLAADDLRTFHEQIGECIFILFILGVP
jgi:hypothetical protein